MSCILRASGKKLNIDELLEIDLESDTHWIKGEPILLSKPDFKKCLTSGANYCVSDAEFYEFNIQKEEAIKYLTENKEKIKAIQSLTGLENLSLDFGIEQRDVAVQSDYFPPELIKLSGELNLGIEISQYPPFDEEV
jgi:hypothetical protein